MILFYVHNQAIAFEFPTGSKDFWLF